MALFWKSKSDLRAVIDIGSHSIKTVVFELAPAYQQTIPAPRVLKKTVKKLGSSPDPVRIMAELREILFATLKELGRVPRMITIALGPYLAEHTISLWSVDGSLAKKKVITRRELYTCFQNLFEQKRDPQRALIAYPLDLLVNGYRISLPPDAKDKIFLGGVASFETLLLYFSQEIGAALVGARQSLGGLPIEFVPLAASYQESIPQNRGIYDAFLIDVGGEETTLSFIKEGKVGQMASFALGAHHFVRGVVRILSISFDEAEDINRQGAQGIEKVSKKGELAVFLKEEALLWKKSFVDELASFYTSGPLPERVFLLGGGAYFAEIVEEVRKPEWIRDFSYVVQPDVQILRAESFFEGNTLGGFLNGPEDAGLASLMIYSMKHMPLFG